MLKRPPTRLTSPFKQGLNADDIQMLRDTSNHVVWSSEFRVLGLQGLECELWLGAFAVCPEQLLSLALCPFLKPLYVMPFQASALHRLLHSWAAPSIFEDHADDQLSRDRIQPKPSRPRVSTWSPENLQPGIPNPGRNTIILIPGTPKTRSPCFWKPLDGL